MQPGVQTLDFCSRHEQLQKADFTMHEVPNSFPDHCMTCTWISSRKTFSWQLHNRTRISRFIIQNCPFKLISHCNQSLCVGRQSQPSLSSSSPSPGWTASCCLDSLPCSNTSKKKKYYHPRSTNNTQHS